MKIKVGVVQESPVFFDKKQTLSKMQLLVKKYTKMGCELLVFPESFIPGYPRGFTFEAKIGSRASEGRKLFKEYYQQSFDLNGKELKSLVKLAKSQNVYLVFGVTEKTDTSGSLYCSMIYISPIKGLLGVHRKIKPTGTERLIWAESDGRSLVSFDTKIGRLGGLICWENLMPLARMSMYQNRVQIYIAPTADSRESWTSIMRHIAMEGRCFVLGCNQYFTKSMYPKKYQHLVQSAQEEMCPGGSVIVSPMGEIIAGPLWGTAGVLIADIDLDKIIESKLDFDPIGHYNRDDVFQLKIQGQPPMIEENKMQL